ncbi:dolichol kinase-like [Xenia sp. Carnegie-2017]|uniref:dolichol kinase-like n=1 Tax=Xenia sp. Carnegie-2017 TaxID=2897299 RepID=UPI001F048E14|nr:dolichol kinase-like [Xenia sp. Carnegie-2017]
MEMYLATSLLVFFTISFLILALLPQSFTLGELMIVSQVLSILCIDFAISIYSRLRFVFPSIVNGTTKVDQLPFTRTEITFILQSFIVGMLLTGLLLLPVFYYLHIVCETLDLWIGYFCFYIICFLSFIAIFLPSLYLNLGGINPFIWFIEFISLNHNRVFLLFYWTIIALFSLFVVSWRYSYPSLTPSNIIVRKIFHVLAVAIFVPGIIYDPALLHLCSTLAISLFIFVEYIRIGHIKPFGELFHDHLCCLTDDKDSGPLILTHVYLLVGCALPLWMFPMNYHHLYQHGCNVLLYAGVLSIGVGDATASVIGVKFGKTKWKGLSKTVEGTLASCLSQFFLLVLLKPYGIKLHSLALTVILSSLLEAFTTQIDNLILPIYTYSLLAFACVT